MGERRCLHCKGPLPDGVLSSRRFCCDRCRRKYQDDRRKEERAMRRLLKSGGLYDPWDKCDLDELTEEEIMALGMHDPLPAGFPWEAVYPENKEEADILAGPMTSLLPKKKKKKKTKL